MMHARALARMSLVAAVLLGGCGGPAQAPEESPDSPEAATPAVPESAPESAPAAAPAPETPAAAAEKIAWRPDLWKNPPLGLPPVPDPQDNRMSAAKVELGRQLYFDRRLSKDGSVSCASCHHPTLGFSNAQRFSPGIGGQVGTRNSPTVYNVAYAKEVFWDGRAETLEAQAIGPILNPIEMGNTVEGLLGTLSGIAEYTPLFEAAFGAPAEITEPHVV
ncbi:MAG: cytochrome-c peroxidase, partial [Myxococcota bacterium]